MAGGSQALEAGAFIASMQREMTDALKMLDRELPSNPDVRLIQRSTGKSAIRLSPLTALAEPANLIRLKPYSASAPQTQRALNKHLPCY